MLTILCCEPTPVPDLCHPDHSFSALAEMRREGSVCDCSALSKVPAYRSFTALHYASLRFAPFRLFRMTRIGKQVKITHKQYAIKLLILSNSFGVNPLTGTGETFLSENRSLKLTHMRIAGARSYAAQIICHRQRGARNLTSCR